MLSLSRRVGEKLVIADSIVVTVLEVGERRARLGISADRSVPIVRAELLRPDRVAELLDGSGGGPRLARELATFRARLPGWLADGLAGTYVAIKGGHVAGVYATWDEALGAAVAAYGPRAEFLLREIAAVERIHHL